MTEIQTSCAILGVTVDTPVEEVKKKAKRLLLRFHPDLNPDCPSESGERTKRVLSAYRTVLEHLKASNPSAQDSPSADSTGGSLLVFAVSGMEFGVELGCIRQVVNAAGVEVLRQASQRHKYYIGCFRHNNAWLSLYEPAALTGDCRHRPSDSAGKIIVLSSSRGELGILVDEVKGVRGGHTSAVYVAVG